MKNYTQPKIKEIQLDAKQAILQVCKIGGVYLTAADDCVYTGGGTIPRICNHTPKAATTFLIEGIAQVENAPS